MSPIQLWVHGLSQASPIEELTDVSTMHMILAIPVCTVIVVTLNVFRLPVQY